MMGGIIRHSLSNFRPGFLMNQVGISEIDIQKWGILGRENKHVLNLHKSLIGANGHFCLS